MYLQTLNTLRLRQNGHHFPDDTFKCNSLNANVLISIKNFIPDGPIKDIAALVQIMAWRRPGNKPLSEPIMVNLLIHICVTQPQWEREREIKFIGLFENRGHRGPYSPYKPFNHNLYIGIIIFPHIDNPQYTGYDLPKKKPNKIINKKKWGPH